MNRLICPEFILSAACFLVFGFATNRGNADVDPLRPPAIETTGVPTVPDELMRELNQYQNIRSAAFAGWSPGRVASATKLCEARCHDGGRAPRRRFTLPC